MVCIVLCRVHWWRCCHCHLLPECTCLLELVRIQEAVMEADESVSDSEVDSTENHAIWIEGEAEPFVDASKIFNGHRALGLISNHIPLVTRYVQRRKETLIVTIIGNSFQTYGVFNWCYLFFRYCCYNNQFCFLFSVEKTRTAECWNSS